MLKHLFAVFLITTSAFSFPDFELRLFFGLGKETIRADSSVAFTTFEYGFSNAFFLSNSSITFLFQHSAVRGSENELDYQHYISEIAYRRRCVMINELSLNFGICQVLDFVSLKPVETEMYYNWSIIKFPFHGQLQLLYEQKEKISVSFEMEYPVLSYASCFYDNAYRHGIRTEYGVPLIYSPFQGRLSFSVVVPVREKLSLFSEISAKREESDYIFFTPIHKIYDFKIGISFL